MDALVTDALRLLGHLPEQELGERAANAVGILALVAGQDVEPAEGSDGRDGRWRITDGTAPDRVISTVDLLSCEDTPVEVFGDPAYSTGDVRHALTAAGHRLFI